MLLYIHSNGMNRWLVGWCICVFVRASVNISHTMSRGNAIYILNRNEARITDIFSLSFFFSFLFFFKWKYTCRLISISLFFSSFYIALHTNFILIFFVWYFSFIFIFQLFCISLFRVFNFNFIFIHLFIHSYFWGFHFVFRSCHIREWTKIDSRRCKNTSCNMYSNMYSNKKGKREKIGMNANTK